MGRVRDWFLEHPPSAWVRCLEGAVRVLNVLNLVLGLVVLVWSVVTVLQMQHEHPSPAPSPGPSLAPSSSAILWLAGSSSNLHAGVLSGHSLQHVPWFIFVFGALGAATALTAGMAILGTQLRSMGCLSTHIFFMCLLLTGQACAAVAFFVDAGWQKRLPDIDEQLKHFLMQRLQVCKWLGIGIALVQLTTLLLSCALQGAYAAAEEAAEDADDEASWARRPLMQQQQRRQQHVYIHPSRGPSPAAGAAAAAGDDDGWSERMQQQYGLDTSQFGYRAGSRGAAAGGGEQQQPSRACVIM